MNRGRVVNGLRSAAVAGIRCWLLVLLAAATPAAASAIDVEPLSTEEKEMRYRVLIAELRCPKCQNENLAESNAPIAQDLRGQVRRLLEEGKSNDQVVAFLVERYGDYIRYRPPVQKNTLVLWFLPALLLVVALVTLALVVHRRRRPAVNQPMTGEDRERLRQLLADDGDDEERP